MEIRRKKHYRYGNLLCKFNIIHEHVYLNISLSIRIAFFHGITDLTLCFPNYLYKYGRVILVVHFAKGQMILDFEKSHCFLVR